MHTWIIISQVDIYFYQTLFNPVRFLYYFLFYIVESRGLVNPLFDEEYNTAPEDGPYNDLADGFAHRDLGEMDSHPGFPIHRTCSGSTTEGSYRPGSLEYLSEPEMKRSSVIH